MSTPFIVPLSKIDLLPYLRIDHHVSVFGLQPSRRAKPPGPSSFFLVLAPPSVCMYLSLSVSIKKVS